MRNQSAIYSPHAFSAIHHLIAGGAHGFVCMRVCVCTCSCGESNGITRATVLHAGVCMINVIWKPKSRKDVLYAFAIAAFNHKYVCYADAGRHIITWPIE